MTGNALGLDVSAHQTRTPSLAGQTFLIARGSYGDYPDQMYHAHADAARAAGLILGAYLFARDQPPADQVRSFLANAGGADFYAVDHEADGAAGTPPRDRTRELVRRLRSTGKPVGLYVNLAGMFDAGADYLWLAYRGDGDPGHGWTILQRACCRPGGDEYRGSPDDMREWIGMARLPAVDPELHRLRVHAGTTVYSPDGAKIDTQAAAAERIGYGRVHLGHGGPVYWAVYTPVQGGRELGFVRGTDVDDLGPLQTGGPSPDDIAAARQQGFDKAKAAAITAVKGI